jgi:hypothetical protein
LPLPETLCLQLYQEDDDPLPTVVIVPFGVTENSMGIGVPKSGIHPHDISWEFRYDPDEVEDSQTELAQSKTGGSCYFWDTLQGEERLLLQLQQRPCGLNFGGYTTVVAVDVRGKLRVALG